MKEIKSYFSFENIPQLRGEEVYTILTEDSILNAENILMQEKIDVSNIFFKLLSQIHYLEHEFEKNKEEIAHIYYLMGYYVGLFLHPFNGNEIAVNYINKAIKIESSQEKIEKYRETIAMIKEEL